MKPYPRSLVAVVRDWGRAFLERIDPAAAELPHTDPDAESPEETAAILRARVQSRLYDQIAAVLAAPALTDKACDYWLSEFEEEGTA